MHRVLRVVVLLTTALLTTAGLAACSGGPATHLVGLSAPEPSATVTATATPTPRPTRKPVVLSKVPAGTAAQPAPPPAGWNVAPGGTDIVGSGRLYRYRVEVEPATGADPASVASIVDTALGGPRGWIKAGLAFQRVSSGPVEMVVRLATPSTVDRLCAGAGLKTNGEVSCRVGSQVVLNQRRWDNGVPAYDGDVASYRILVVNHEVGHRLGNSGHPPCPGAGLPQPVMMQVFYTGLQGCAKNIWPYAEDGTRIG